MGLSSLIHGDGRYQICGEAGDAPRARELFASHQPELAVIDLLLHQGDGIELIKDFKKQNPAAAALVLTSRQDTLSVTRAFGAGARGYLVSDDETVEILRAIERLIAGEIYVSGRVAKCLVENLTGKRPNGGAVDAPASLSDRELQVLRLIGSGFRTSQVAAELHLSVKTVETHRARIKTKLGLKTAEDLSQYASGWVVRTRESSSACPG